MTIKALLVDDSEEFRLLTAQYIAIEWPDAEVEEWDPGLRGDIPATYDLSTFSVLLLDHVLGLENVSGLDWLATLMKRPACPPVIYLTGAGSENMAVKALKLGASDYLPKRDLSKERLVSAITSAMRERGAELNGVNTQPLRGRVAVRSGTTHPQTGTFRVDTGISPGGDVLINGYKVVRKIGAGGMSTVYLAERNSDGLMLVLKIMDASLTQDDEYLKRFIQEYGIVSRIDSPHVVKIHDQGFTDRHVYIAMEYFSGGDLRSRIRNGVPRDHVLPILRQVTAALEAVHAKGIVHRDLKPDNIMFRPDESAALVDFGIAKMTELASGLTVHGDVLGTPHYLSPEQAAAMPLDGRSDLYNLGIMFYEMLTGRRPFRAEDAIGLALKHLNEPMPRLPQALSRYQELLDCLTAKKREDRFPDARALSEYLDVHFATESAEDTEPLLDEPRLAQLQSDCDARPGTYAVMLRRFAEGAERQAAEIEVSFAAGRFDQIEHLVHKLKGGAGAYGAARLAQLSGIIESAIRAGATGGLQPLVSLLVECAGITSREFHSRAAMVAND
jgi:serine/threonine protein kinase/DNA-binding NarL/FixJ family response regulator